MNGWRSDEGEFLVGDDGVAKPAGGDRRTGARGSVGDPGGAGGAEAAHGADGVRGDEAVGTATTLSNVFRWSASRDRMFGECRRRYWYNYYGHWLGWEDGADPAARETWFLKQVQSRHMWLGDVVHRTVAFALAYARHHRELPPLGDLADRADRLMREEFRASRDDVLRRSGSRMLPESEARAARLFEHEYDLPVADSEWKSIHGKVLQALRQFADSKVVRAILRTPAERWMPIEEFEEFLLGRIPVAVKLDFAFLDGDVLKIVDWKTGSRPSPPDTMQLACYALFARAKWRFPVDRIRTLAVNLVRDETTEHQVAARDLEVTARYIQGSAAEMLGLVEDPDRNDAPMEMFPAVEEMRICRWCNFQRVCLGGTAREKLGRRSRPGR